MKRIEVIGPVTLKCSRGVFPFQKGRVYEVEDDIAAHPYLVGQLKSCIDVKKPDVDDKKAAKKAEPKTTRKAKSETEDVNADDGKAVS